ncbi:MAG: hypothetical protein ACKPFK_23265, partial [Dolichospermum sp.]
MLEISALTLPPPLAREVVKISQLRVIILALSPLLKEYGRLSVIALGGGALNKYTAKAPMPDGSAVILKMISKLLKK